jgi:hypothetical protein
MDNLTKKNRDDIASAFNAVRAKNGRTFVDEKEAAEADDLIDLFAVASGAKKIGAAKTRSMIEQYGILAHNKKRGLMIKITIRSEPPGTVTDE